MGPGGQLAAAYGLTVRDHPPQPDRRHAGTIIIIIVVGAVDCGCGDVSDLRRRPRRIGARRLVVATDAVIGGG